MLLKSLPGGYLKMGLDVRLEILTTLYSMQNHRQTKFAPHVKTKFSVLLSGH